MESASTRLRQLLESATPIPDLLPLIHITDAYSFADILAPRQLIPYDCAVFNRPILYMFYGRPSYRTKHGGSSYITANLPVVLVFHPGRLLDKIKDVYPFDTGAFKLGIYAPFFHQRSALEHYRLPGNIDSANRIIGYFYRSAQEYYVGGSRKNVEIPPLHFEAESIFELARASKWSPGKTAPDDRSSSIEIQITEKIDITNELLALIVPQIFYDDPESISKIGELNVKQIETYSSINKLGDDSLAGMIFEKVESIFKKNGIFK